MSSSADEKLLTTVHEASASWKAAFNYNNADGCAAQYEEDAVMIAKPFGTFKGREEIQGFWQKAYR